MYDLLFLPFEEFSFMRRALTGGLALSLGAAPVGVFLMLRRMSLMGDAMAHAILPGAAIGYLLSGLSLSAMTLGGLGAGISVALLAGLVARTTVLREDASLAAFYLISLALGVVIVSLRGSNVDLLHVLFGTVLALDDNAIYLLASITTVTLISFAAIFRPLVLDTMDPGFLRNVSPRGSLVHFVFLGLVVLNLVAAFHALGTLMAVGLMILPAAAARFWMRGIGGLLALSMLFAFVSCWAGLVLSYHLSLPSGPAIVLSAGVIYVLSILVGSANGILPRYLPARHLEG
jgi:zinc/manganese transport system permease protein